MKSDSSGPQPHTGAAGTTVVAAGTTVNGEVSGSASLVVEGVVEGRLHLDNDVAVGKEGLVTGEIDAKSVRVGGRVKGNIRGLEMIEILANGSVEGDVRSPRVVIADGAFFKGKVEMGGLDKSTPPVKKRFE
ncbi:MAG: polymer-forming cytoskeletal protein [Acidobacteriota bacterium]|nr:polymer-forming cytoskeletal protein [Acidobacteriota bacterium]